MGAWAAVGILVIGTVVVYACVMCLVPRHGDAGEAHPGHH